MRAFIVPEFGDSGSVGERPRPEPGADQLLVRVEAAGVNAMDTILRGGYARDYMEHRLPLTPGLEYAGRVEAVGSGVEGFAVGDPVFGVVGKPYFGEGSFAEFVTAAANLAVRRPDGLDADQAASLTQAGTTALAALDAVAVEVGDTIAIVGAGGGVGSFAVALAALRGLRVIALTRADSADHVRALGASEVVDYTADDVVEQLRRLEPNGLGGLIDTFHEAQDLLVFVPALRPGATIASPKAMGADALFADQPVNAVVASAAVDRAAEIGELVARGAIAVPLETLPLERAAEALDRQASGDVRGKLVISIDEAA